MGRKRIKYLHNAKETELLGREFAHTCTILALQGDLGAGKTTFVQGLAKELGIREVLQSPTFTFCQIYEGSCELVHFDLYRLNKESDFLLLGFEEQFDSKGIVVIEWPERIATLIPKTALLVTLAHSGEGRTATIQSWEQR